MTSTSTASRVCMARILDAGAAQVNTRLNRPKKPVFRGGPASRDLEPPCRSGRAQGPSAARAGKDARAGP